MRRRQSLFRLNPLLVVLQCRQDQPPVWDFYCGRLGDLCTHYDSYCVTTTPASLPEEEQHQLSSTSRSVLISFPSFSVPLNKGGAHCPQSTTSTHFSINNCCRSQPQPCCGDNSCLMAQGEDNQSGVWSDRTAPNVSLNVSVGHWAVVCGSGQ